MPIKLSPSIARATASRRLLRALPFALSVCVLLCILACTFAPAPNSDAVEGVLWADAALRAGRPLNPDYAYPYAIPFGANIIFMPFVALFGVSQIANSLGCLLYYVLLVITIAYFMHALSSDWVRISVGTAIAMMAFCSTNGQNFIHHILHYQLGFHCMVGILAAIMHLIASKEFNRLNCHSVLLVFFVLWAGANGMPTVALAVIPAVLGLLAMALTSEDVRALRFPLVRILPIVFGFTAIGYFLYKLSMLGIQDGHYIEQLGSYTLRGVDEWTSNLLKLPTYWMRAVLMVDPAGVGVFTKRGIITLLSTAFAIVVLFAPFIYARCRKNRDELDWLLIGCTATIWAIVLLQSLCFRGPEIRLLFPAMMTDCLILGAMVVRNSANAKIDFSSCFISAIAAGMTALLCITLVGTTDWELHLGTTKELSAHGLNYGFASFWDANFNTVTSGNEVKIRPIECVEGSVVPFHFQSEGAWYSSEGKELNDDRWFIMLTSDQWKGMRASSKDLPTVKCSEHFQIGKEYHVFVFDKSQWESCLSGKVTIAE